MLTKRFGNALLWSPDIACIPGIAEWVIQELELVKGKQWEKLSIRKLHQVLGVVVQVLVATANPGFEFD